MNFETYTNHLFSDCVRKRKKCAYFFELYTHSIDAFVFLLWTTFYKILIRIVHVLTKKDTREQQICEKNTIVKKRVNNKKKQKSKI